VTLRWDAIDFAHGQIHVSRAKNGSSSVHPLSGVELRALRRLKREQGSPSPFVFNSERGSPFTTAGWRKMVARLGVAAKLGFQTHPHMLRLPAAFNWRTRAPTPARCKPISAIAKSSTPCAIPNCRPRASKTSGAIDDHRVGPRRRACHHKCWQIRPSRTCT
jgi:hypothetical protein